MQRALRPHENKKLKQRLQKLFCLRSAIGWFSGRLKAVLRGVDPVLKRERMSEKKECWLLKKQKDSSSSSGCSSSSVSVPA